VKILVKYTPPPGNVTYLGEFEIEINNITSSITIPYENRFFIAKDNDFTQVSNRVNNFSQSAGGNPEDGNFLFVFSENINLAQMSFNITVRDITIFMVATVPGLTIGRNGAANINITGSRNARIFLGRWPFNEPAFAGGDVLNNEFFQINAGGTWQNYGNPPIQTSYLFVRSTSGTVTVEVLSGIDVWHENRVLYGWVRP